jgi:ribosomal protein S18 acetylase RimI-like enzyme
MPDPRTIRAAVKGDLATLLTLYQHLIPDDAQPTAKAAAETFGRFLAYRGRAIYLAESAGELVASCTLVVIPNLTRGGRPYGLVENVITHSAHRNRGHGSANRRQATRAAFEAGCDKVMLLTGSTDPATHAFYRAAGFETTKTGYQLRALRARESSA